MHFIIDSTIGGLGISLLPSWIGDPLVEQGKLVAILPKFSTTTPLHLLTHGSRHLPRRVILLRDFLFEKLSRECGGHTCGGSHKA